MQGVYFDLNHSGAYYNAIMNYARITPPEIKTNYVDIPGGDASLDLTESVGGIRLKSGKVNFKFTFIGGRADAAKMISDIHGMRKKITLDRDMDYELAGRIEVTTSQLENNLYVVEATATVDPYKVQKKITVHTEVLGNRKDIVIVNSRKPVMPKITVTGEAYIVHDSIKYKMQNGIYEIPEITFYGGINRLTVYGNGTITFEYRKGEIIC